MKPAMKVRILHHTEITEGHSYLIDDGSREVSAGTKRSEIHIFDVGAVTIIRDIYAPGGYRLLIVDLEGVKVLYGGITL